MQLSKQQLFSALFLAIVSLAILMMAVPRFIASLYVLYPESVISHPSDNIPAEAYTQSLKALDSALAWDDNPDYWQAKSVCHFALVNYPNTPLVQQYLHFIEARKAMVLGLSLSPVDASAWFKLAFANKTLQQPASAVTDALRLSVYAARVEPELTLQRWVLAYTYWDYLTIEDKSLWLKQVPIAWQYMPKKLVSFVIENPSAKSLVESALINNVDGLNSFNETYDNAIKKFISTPNH